MKLTVQYIPLSKIKPDSSLILTDHIKKLRSYLWDCMHLLAVRRNRKDDSFVILSGHERYEYLRKHTNKKFAPCIIDDPTSTSDVKTLFYRLLSRQQLSEFPEFHPLVPTSWSIIRTFIKQEPRFSDLTISQQVKVLLLGIRYKKTVLFSMRSMVDDIHRNKGKD